MRRKLSPARDLADNGLSRLSPVLRLLHGATTAAVASGRDVWQFALELHWFQANGIGAADLRLLLAAGLIEHAIEKPARNGMRHFRRVTSLSIPLQTCFVLTPSGARFTEQVLAADRIAESSRGESTQVVPIWDPARRELRRDLQVIKRFRWKAVNQELILGSFQELAWIARIDDPLPPARGLAQSTRLRDTLRTLNLHQSNPRVRFTSDGTGRGVLWQWVPTAPDVALWANDPTRFPRGSHTPPGKNV